MKKSKRPRQPEADSLDRAPGGQKSPGRRDKPAGAAGAAALNKEFLWWPWAAALAALLVLFEIYSPALHGPFVLDDLYFPYASQQLQGMDFLLWIKDPRPVLMLSFWLNFLSAGQSPFAYHVTNVLLHFLTAVVTALIAMRLVDWAGAGTSIHAKRTLGIFAGALFLVHPMQTESVAYVASRSEVLSVLFYYSAFCLFLYRRGESIGWLRTVAVLVLFGAAVGTKQHTLTLPVLFLLTDLFWAQGSLRANRLLYALLAVGGVAGAAFILPPLLHANTVGLHVAGMTPLSYFFTESRVVWTYVRLFVLPFGQNADPDVPISAGPFDDLAIVALLAWIGVIAAAWLYRKRFPLASYGIFVFLLLIAPTSSFIPIADAQQERRLYLPFIGLALMCLEFLRRVDWRRRVMIEAPVLAVLLVLTYQRAEVWGDPMALWKDTVAKSPKKVRPRFQLAEAYYEDGQFPQAAEQYEIASHLAPPDYRLLVNYGLTLDREGLYPQALEKFQRATGMEADPEAWTLMAQVYGQQHKVDEAMHALEQAQQINANFEMTYAIRGNVYESVGNLDAAAGEYQHALRLDPYNDAVRQALQRIQRPH